MRWSSRRRVPPMARKQLNASSKSTNRLSTLLPGCFLFLLLSLMGVALNLSQNMKENDVGGVPTLQSETIVQDHPTIQKADLLKSTSDIAESERKPSRPSAKLRFDWTNLPVQSEVAKLFEAHQSKSCDLPLANYPFRNRFGLGSDLHVWTQAVCNAMALGVRLRSVLPWIWWAEDSCHGNSDDDDNAMMCYFPKAELQCPQDMIRVAENDIPTNMTRRQGYRCDDTPLWQQYNKSEIRAGGIEYLFQSVSKLIVEEAERQLLNVFPDGVVPPDLITVQVRWGDKKVEMGGVFVQIEEYIEGIHTLLRARKASPDTANIFLATEDPVAVAAFTKAAPSGWKVFVDHYHTELKSVRGTMKRNHTKGSNYNNNPGVTMATKGQAGLVALASLLVSMEANDFVLTTTSNWSRLMDELRKNVVDPRCNGCTNMVDLMSGEW